MGTRRTPRWLQAAREASKEGLAATRPDWLARALARAGVLPLAEAEQAIRAGRVEVDGQRIRQPFAPVRPDAVVRVDGRGVDVRPRTRVLMFHKPMGAVVAGADREGSPTVFERLAQVLPAELQGFQWHAVGRLDRNTTGLLLFTNDERFVAHATSPQTHLPKTYLAQVGSDVTLAKLEPLRRGIELEDGPCRPARATQLGPREVELVISEGRNHQVKRMLAAVKLPVLSLHRSSVGALVLDVELGAWRELSPEELRDQLGYLPRGAG